MKKMQFCDNFLIIFGDFWS